MFEQDIARWEPSGFIESIGELERGHLFVLSLCIISMVAVVVSVIALVIRPGA